MAYEISTEDLNKLSEAMQEYYQDAWEGGIRKVADRIAHKGQGFFPKYLDQFNDSYVSFVKKSDDKFGVTFKAQIKANFKIYTGNHNDLALNLVIFAERALKELTKLIPFPYVGEVASEIVKGVGSLVAKGLIGEAAASPIKSLQKRAVNEADNQIKNSGDANLSNFLTTDTEAQKEIAASIEQYKLICKLIQAMPKGQITTFEDAVTFPAATFKLQEAASSLNIMVYKAKLYFTAMEERLTLIETLTHKFLKSVQDGTKDSVKNVLDHAYDAAFAQGKTDCQSNKYRTMAKPEFIQPSKSGGATQLAAYLAHATAMGYYDAAPIVTRARRNAVW